MKKLLLGIVAACMATPMVAQDPATYQPVNGYSIENLWMKSVATNNNMDELVGGNRSRGMTVRNGEVLYSYRSDFTGIKVYDLKTGDFKKDVKFDTEKFKVSYAYTKVVTRRSTKRPWKSKKCLASCATISRLTMPAT